MITITVPFHLDEALPDLRWAVVPGSTQAGAVIAPELPDGSTWERLAHLYDQVAAEVARHAGARPVLVQSGDCTTSLGTVAGLQRSAGADGQDLGIVWFDAHGDLQTPQTTASGYLGGMPLRMLLGEGDSTVGERLGLRPVPPSEVVLVDARDLDPPEREYLATSPVRHCTVDEVTAQTLPERPLYLHIDLDVLDPAYLPESLFPAPNGPDPAEVAAALRAVLATGRVGAVGLGCTWGQGQDLSPDVRALVAELLTHL